MKIVLVLISLTPLTYRLYATPDLFSSPYSQQDTVLAVHKLFTQKRLTVKGFVGVGGVGMVFGAVRQSVPIAAAGLVSAGFGLIRLARFGKRREAAVLQHYTQGVGLPKRVRRQLKANYFN